MEKDFSNVGYTMSLSELISRLKALKDNNFDIEDRHIEADDLLLEFINIKEVKDAFDELEKWYA
jgi:hypothetical protein